MKGLFTCPRRLRFMTDQVCRHDPAAISFSSPHATVNILRLHVEKAATNIFGRRFG